MLEANRGEAELERFRPVAEETCKWDKHVEGMLQCSEEMESRVASLPAGIPSVEKVTADNDEGSPWTPYCRYMTMKRG